jgi:hypothetical protein
MSFAGERCHLVTLAASGGIEGDVVLILMPAILLASSIHEFFVQNPQLKQMI